ncbi:hypothetical protein [Mangrovicoccus sp. HB161399]|uniref:hypothetical protein n=1 Tax=Mangrovicoccus sp. HB161399 TaxID=2720392 RepID=UPI0015522D76|nr:hypothetical protein [Mangrovicoccus sp. HB161399]
MEDAKTGGGQIEVLSWSWGTLSPGQFDVSLSAVAAGSGAEVTYQAAGAPPGWARAILAALAAPETDALIFGGGSGTGIEPVAVTLSFADGGPDGEPDSLGIELAYLSGGEETSATAWIETEDLAFADLRAAWLDLAASLPGDIVL